MAAKKTKKAKKTATTKAAPKKISMTAKALPNNSASLTPLDDRLVVVPEEASHTTPGGLIIPHTASERPVRGTVLAKGPGRRNKKGQLRPLDVKVGDHVMFAEYAGTKISLDGKEVLILREEDVLGIVT